MAAPDLCLSTAHYLKHHTAAQHEALEAVVLPRLQSLENAADYNLLLQQFYGYLKPVEDLIAQKLDETDLPDLAQRRNMSRILQDLAFSNAHTDPFPLATELPRIQNKLEAFGALYVLEGSTLGGRTITKLLMKKDHLQLSEKQLRYFNGYGAATGTMWRAFLDRLNAHGTTTAVLTPLKQAANQTFLLFKNWLSLSIYEPRP